MTDGVLDSQRTRFMAVIRNVTLFLGGLAAIATLAVAWIQLTPANPELELTVTDVESLTELPEVRGLSGTFRFNMEPVDNLLSIRVRIRNSGKATIIGIGQRANVLHDRLTFAVSDSLRVLDLRVIRNDFDGTVFPLGDSAIALSFDQWKVGEVVEFALYSDGSLPADTSMAVTPIRRDLVDGDIVVSNARVSANEAETIRRSNAIRQAGPIMASLLKAVGYITLLFGALILLIIPIALTYDYLRARRWHRKYGLQFKRFTGDLKDDLGKLVFTLREAVAVNADPHLLPKEAWEHFSGPKYPSTSDSFSGKQLVAYTLFTFFLLVGCYVMYQGLRLL